MIFSKEYSVYRWGIAVFCILGILKTEAHMSMIYPLPRGHPLNPNRGGDPDYDCRDAPLYVECAKRQKTFPCGGYPRDKVVTQSFDAGQAIYVKFGNAQFGPPPQQVLTPESNQARHAGGLCEFSLSYDQGQTFGVFARYHGSCPDMFYDWPVKLPDNLPSCDDCIFGWSWISAAGTNPEYYMSCADIKITGKSGSNGGTLPPEIANVKLQLANMPGYNYYHVPGDEFGNTKSNGPDQKQKSDNLKGLTGGEYTETRRSRRKRSHLRS